MQVQGLSNTCYNAREYRRPRLSWQEETRRLNNAWKDIIPTLADLYIKWRGLVDGTSPSEPPPQPVEHAVPSSSTTEPAVKFDMSVVDMYTLATVLPVELPQHEAIVPHLVTRGYLCTSPSNPSLAISLRTLEFYHRLRRRKASFGVETFAKVLCNLYGVGPSACHGCQMLIVPNSAHTNVGGTVPLPMPLRYI